ncbi:MAG: efflux RND transporter permease subunit [Spirochaetes bacterium]|nr:efflux RND transporter permease subunit [Spirochaetota bacterium]
MALLPFFNVDLDTVTLTAMVIVIGIIVDDAIIISENIFRRRELGDAPIDAAINGTYEVYKPVITTILTTFLAFAPMFFMKGMLGKFVYVIPLTISIALFISMFEALTVLPAHILPGLRIKKDGKIRLGSRKWFKPIRDKFEALILKILKFRYVCIVVAITILAGALFYTATSMNFVLFPSKGAEDFWIIIELPTGSSLKATSDKVKEIESIIEQKIPKKELESYGVRIGQYTDQFVETEMENFATMFVNLTPYGTRKHTADQIVEEIRKETEKIKGIKNIKYFIDAGGPPTGKPVELHIVGSDDIIRTRLANDVEAYLKTAIGVKDIDRNDKLGKEQIEIKINYTRLSRLELTVADIADNVRIAYDGQVVTTVRHGEEDLDFRVILNKKARRNIDYLQGMLIPNLHGKLIPLYEVASLKYGPGLSSIHHYKGERSITITADIIQEKTTSVKVMNAIQEGFNPDKNYPGTRLIIGGEAQESSKAMIDLMITFVIAALGIYFLLILLFNSFTQPFMVILAIPFGFSGVVFAFALHGEPLSFLAMTGIIGMAGVVVNDSLVLVNHLNNMRQQGDIDYLKLIASGTADRLRPIILTTLTTVGGLIPLVYGIGGQSLYMGPMAMALAYGLLFATPLTLIIMPCIYMIGYDIKNNFKRIKIIKAV